MGRAGRTSTDDQRLEALFDELLAACCDPTVLWAADPRVAVGAVQHGNGRQHSGEYAPWFVAEAEGSRARLYGSPHAGGIPTHSCLRRPDAAATVLKRAPTDEASEQVAPVVPPCFKPAGRLDPAD